MFRNKFTFIENELKCSHSTGRFSHLFEKRHF